MLDPEHQTAWISKTA